MANADWYYGSIAKLTDKKKLEDLLEIVRKGDEEETKSNLLALVGSRTGGYILPDAWLRARVYCYLIAAAANLKHEDIPAKKMEIWESKKQIQGRQRKEVVQSCSDDKLQVDAIRTSIADENKVLLQYLYKDVLEEDEDVMTVIFCNSQYFERCPVPYFEDCKIEVVKEITNYKLWPINQEILEFYFYQRFFKGIIENLSEDSSTEDEGFIKAKQILCGHLCDRGQKAGARLLWLLTKMRHDDHQKNLKIGGLIEELVKEVFVDWDIQRHFLTIPVLGDYGKFDLDSADHRINDIVKDGRGERICVGELCGVGPVGTDDILLCWAARRNYHDLIWCVMKAYKTKSDDGYNDWREPFEAAFVWKIALWCATRHGDFWIVIKELSQPEWIKCIDLNDYPVGWLPPLHLAAIFGDMDRMETLCKYLNVKNCANKKDYMGRTPLEYAMQFPVATRMSKPTTVCYKGVVRKLLSMKGVDERLKEINDIYINQANTVLIGAALVASVTFAAWMQPPLGYNDYFQFARPLPQPSDGQIYYESYLAIQGHPSIHAFVVFNTLSFFLAIATVLLGAEATLYVHDNDEKTMALRRMRTSSKYMIGFFISSMLCIMVAFICAGISILPPIRSLRWSMIISLVTGGAISIVPICWIYSSLNKNGGVLSYLYLSLNQNEGMPSFGNQCIDLARKISKYFSCAFNKSHQPRQSSKKGEKVGLIDKDEFKRRQEETKSGLKDFLTRDDLAEARSLRCNQCGCNQSTSDS